MDFQERFKLYIDGGMITMNDIEDIKNIIRLFDEKYHIELCEENASFFISHICAMYHRNQTNERLDDITDNEMEEIQNLKTYSESLRILEDIKREIKIQVNDVEGKYLLLHINQILQNGGEKYVI